MTYRLTFDITARNADASELLDRLIEFQQELVDEIEEDEDWNGNIIENVGDEDTCSVHNLMLQVRDKTLEVFRNNTLADIA